MNYGNRGNSLFHINSIKPKNIYWINPNRCGRYLELGDDPDQLNDLLRTTKSVHILTHTSRIDMLEYTMSYG